MDPTIKQHVYTLEEAATLLKVEPVTVRRLILRGKLPRVAFIRHIRIPAAAVERLANGSTPL
jgi:excisionase family DNA binding protein